jgi:hypothetical protein
MPKRKVAEAQDQSTSARWPNFFKDVEVAELLLEEPGFRALLEDCRLRVADLSYDVVHGVASDPAVIAQQNFERGQLSIFEYLVELGEELQKWKEGKK